MNFNTSPIAFFPSCAAQIWRAWFAQRKISVICGNDLLPFYIIDNGNAPTVGELYDPNTDTKVDDIDFAGHLLDHDITVDGQSAHIWIYQGEMAGVFGRTNPGYYYLKIGNWYSDVFRIGDLSSEYTEINWQFYDDIITADGTPISKNIKYRQIFETPLWHPEYNIEEEGKTNNGIFYAMSQTTKKTSGFNAIVNESQLDCLNLTRMADNIIIRACLNGTTKTLQTNQFEISSKWESDDVASIECQFDLFSIIRKYQQSNVEPEPLPIPVPPTPSIYKIKGTTDGSISSLQIYANAQTNVVFVNDGNFEFGYDEQLTSMVYFGTNATHIKTLDLTESCGLGSVNRCLFNACTNLTNINFGNCTFASIDNAASMFEGLKHVGTFSLPEATFASATDTSKMFKSCRASTISMPKATFANVTKTDEMFYSTDSFWNIDLTLTLATFASVTSAKDMFYYVKTDSNFVLPAATFAALTDATAMFRQASPISNFVFADSLPNWSASVTDATSMFEDVVGGLNVSALDCSNVTTADYMFASKDISSLTIPTTLTSLTRARNMFDGAKASVVQSAINTSALTFAVLTDAKGMFANITGSTTDFSLPNVTFAAVLDCSSMFANAAVKSITMAAATFESATTTSQMVYNCTNLETLDLPSCTFAAITGVNVFEPISICGNLENITLAETNTIMPRIFNLKLQKVTSASIISVLNSCGRDADLPNQYLYLLQTRYSQFTPTEQSDIETAKTNIGWEIVLV